VHCPSCQAAIPDSSRFCPSCGRAIAGDAKTAAATDDAATRLSGGEVSNAATRMAPGGEAATRMASSASRSPAATSGGWLSTSGAIDHGQFAPGTILDGRYRINGLLGRGGMGEVYRADDLRLGQPVALKFLPDALMRDPTRLAQFHNEVRTARQVSHPNVCRVYDIGEVEGHLYLSMEYVDGEDLAMSLRRIGRFPEDKALEIARQMCAGLAAAHERGVLHRDLKPANVMLDGSGKVRIMDFSLASIGEVSDVRAGTPAYMAPEQLHGREVTARSDVFALGLVLYELFTGRRAFTAKTIADLVEQHESQAITAPSALITTLDPVIERAIQRCLDPEPARRPSSALAVSAALPGGDPLAAALAAGETPSPELVAAAGGEGAAISQGVGIAWLAIACVALIALAALGDRVSLLGRIPLRKPAPVLVDRAMELREKIGYTEPFADSAFGVRYDADFLNWAVANGAGSRRWSDVEAGRPSVLLFWRRTSPLAMVPYDDYGRVGVSDPPLLVSGMTYTELDTEGRLARFIAIPPQIEPPAATAPPVNWALLFDAAGLDVRAFTESAPSRTPAAHSDERRAWQGPLAGTDHPVRVEAAAYRGRPTFFEIVGPWTRAARQVPFTPSGVGSAFNVAGTLLVATLPIGAALMARRNLKKGRADNRSALRLAGFVFIVMMGHWALEPHISNVGAETNRMFIAIGLALFNGALLFVVYLALEPWVRRTWPDVLITSTRLLSGRLTDPRVGRDLLIGVALGVLFTLLHFGYLLLPATVGRPAPLPATLDAMGLLGFSSFVASALVRVVWALQNGLIAVLVFAVIRGGLALIPAISSRRVLDGVSAVVAAVLFTIVSSRGAQLDTGYFWYQLAYQGLTLLVTMTIILRFGLFATVVVFYVSALTGDFPLTFDGSRLYANQAWLLLVVVAAAAVAGLWLARGNRPAAPGVLTGG
jgi:hypothetical protein